MASLKRTREMTDLELDEIETFNHLKRAVEHAYHMLNVLSDRDDEIKYHERQIESGERTSTEIELLADEIEIEYCPCCGEVCEHFDGGRCVTCATSDSQLVETDYETDDETVGDPRTGCHFGQAYTCRSLGCRVCRR